MVSKMVIVLLVSVLNFSGIAVNAFEIVDSGSEPSMVRIGDKVVLKCKSDDHWEYCTWKHDSWVCNFEWKYSASGVRKQTCSAIGHRTDYTGIYDSHECDIELLNVTMADEGIWTCTMEQYKLGITRGYTDKAEIQLKLLKETTTTTTTPATTSIKPTPVDPRGREGGNLPRPRQDFQDNSGGLPVIFPDHTTRKTPTSNATKLSSTPKTPTGPGKQVIFQTTIPDTSLNSTDDTDNHGAIVVTSNGTSVVAFPGNSTDGGVSSEQSGGAKSGDVIVPAAVGSILVLLLVGVVAGFLVHRHRQKYSVVDAWRGRKDDEMNDVKLDGDDEQRPIIFNKNNSNVNLSALDVMDKNNSEKANSFIDGSNTLEAREQNPPPRNSPASALFQ